MEVVVCVADECPDDDDEPPPEPELPLPLPPAAFPLLLLLLLLLAEPLLPSPGDWFDLSDLVCLRIWLPDPPLVCDAVCVDNTRSLEGGGETERGKKTGRVSQVHGKGR